MNVGNRIPEVFLVSNHTVEVVLCSDRAIAFERKVNVACATTFPLLNDFPKFRFVALLDENVDMIWHDAPRE